MEGTASSDAIFGIFCEGSRRRGRKNARETSFSLRDGDDVVRTFSLWRTRYRWTTHVVAIILNRTVLRIAEQLAARLPGRASEK
jgi:hypothetical protein